MATQDQRQNKGWANLTPHKFKPGQSGNPGGRPKNVSLTAEMRRVLEGRTLNGKRLPKGQNVLRKAAEAIVLALIDGDMQAARIMLDRLDGPIVLPAIPPPSDNFGDLNANVPPGLAEAQRQLAAEYALKQLGLEGSAPDED